MKSASYDLKLGNKILVTPIPPERKKGSLIYLEKGKSYQIRHGEFVSVISKEKLILPKDISGRFGVRSKFSRRGLITFGGPQIDPGWRGKLVVSLLNVGPEPISIKPDEKFFTVEFFKLESPAEKGYGEYPPAEYQNQYDFPASDVEFIKNARSTSLSNIESLRRIVSAYRSPTWLLAIFPALAGVFGTLTVVHFYLGNVSHALGSIGITIMALLGTLFLCCPSLKRKLKLS